MVIPLAALAAILAAPPQRIVSTAPSVTEMLYALGLGDRVAAVTTFCRYPPEAARKPRIGDYLRPNLELIVAARPDLVIVERTGLRQPEPLAAARFPVLEVDDATLAGIYESIQRIAQAAGVPERAAALNRRIRGELDEVRRRAAGLPRPRTMFVLGRTPGRLEGIVVAGRATYLDELIGLAGGRNIFADTVSAYSKVPLEQVLARDPEVILDMAEMADPGGLTEERKRAVVALWERQPLLTAVRRRRVHALDSAAFLVPGPRVTEAARALLEMIHPAR